MRIIDTHFHYVTPYYRKTMAQYDMLDTDLVPIPDWSLEIALNAINGAGTDIALLSATSPNQSFGDQALAIELTREINESGAEYVQKYPDRFLLAASLPLPYAEASLEEIRYSYDVLHCSAIRLLSNSCGVYPGHPDTEEVFAELNRRNAVCILHPTRPAHLPENTMSSITVPIFEFFPETVRAVINLIFTGTVSRYPNIRFVVPHCGALFIPIIERLQELYKRLLPTHPELEDIDIIQAAKTLYFDIAGNPLPRQLDNLLTFTDEDHVLYGTDFPYYPPAKSKETVAVLENRDQTSYLNEKLFCKNAEKLLGLNA